MALMFTSKMPLEDKANFLFNCIDFDGERPFVPLLLLLLLLLLLQQQLGLTRLTGFSLPFPNVGDNDVDFEELAISLKSVEGTITTNTTTTTATTILLPPFSLPPSLSLHVAISIQLTPSLILS